MAGIYGRTATGGIPALVNSSGLLGTTSSSRRYKTNIQDMGEASSPMMRLRPVTFKYNPDRDPTGEPQFGLIAEEVQEVMPDLVVRDQDGQPETVRYHVMTAMLLNELQKLQARLATLEARCGGQ